MRGEDGKLYPNKNMRLKNLILTGVATVALALGVKAALPTFKSMSATGTAASPAQIIFPDDANSQIRIVNVYYQSDTNGGQLQLSSGAGAYVLLATNTSSGVTQVVNQTTGLAANDILVLNHAGTCYAASLSSTNSGTNAVLASGAWGVTPAIGDSVYKMSSITSLNVGAATNAINGEAVYVGNYGRPVLLKLTPSLVTNALPSASAHYDSQTQ